MSHFYGILNGQAVTSATRRGSKASGIRARVASWAGCIYVSLYVDADGRDCYVVEQVPWHGAGIRQTLAVGFVGKPIARSKDRAA